MKFEIASNLPSMIINYNSEMREHGIRVSHYAGCLAEKFGLNEERVRVVELAAMLHDIGKLIIPANILNKPTKLTDEEFVIVQKHPEHTSKILRNINGLKSISKLTLYHHERYDGSGYPKGLKGDDIPFESQIISIADVFDALTSDRPYRKAIPVSTAINLMIEESGRQFKPELVFLAVNLFPEIYKILNNETMAGYIV